MRVAIVVGLLILLAGGILAYRMVRPHIPAAERGRRLAEATGCFACHGPSGLRGTANPGRTDEAVPNFEGDVMMFAESEEEIHEWIHEGVTKDRAMSQTWRRDRERGVLKMPAFKGKLSEPEMEDLVAFVAAVSGLHQPEEPPAAQGLVRAEALGCTGCHGAGGRLALPNPGSLKGYVPSWDGADFPELVHDRQEFNEWVEEGVSRRLAGNPFAQFFLKRATLVMPAYREHLQPGDLEAIWAYIDWLRAPKGTESEPHSH